MEKSLDGGHCCEARMVCGYESSLEDDCKRPTTDCRLIIRKFGGES